MAENIIPFPRPHRGDSKPLRMALAAISFRRRGSMWRLGRVILSNAGIDAIEARMWAQCLRRWTTPRRRALE